MSVCQPSRPDHPRVCGERFRFPVFGQCHGGSSPRVRGTQALPGNGHARKRIIPACAGNAANGMTTPAALADHPRVCGERLGQAFSTGAQSGSSPRVRGTRKTSAHSQGSRRIIPACAGNAVVQVGFLLHRSDHPRVCGERSEKTSSFSLDRGSSPRVRGTPVSLHAGDAGRRIIPACAGNALGDASHGIVKADHPRVCGERKGKDGNVAVKLGSSPRVRGTLCARLRALAKRRIIPACAGNADIWPGA